MPEDDFYIELQRRTVEVARKECDKYYSPELPMKKDFQTAMINWLTARITLLELQMKQVSGG